MDVDLEAAVADGTGKPQQETDRLSSRKVNGALDNFIPLLDEMSDRELWVVFVRLQQYRLLRITRYELPGHCR